MDIAKYVGLFLLKSEYCFLPGIGGLQVIKKPASFNRDTHEMSAPSYSLVYDQRIGAIDDSFANYIATNERISIVHAANYLKDFCARAKQDIREGREVEIPAIGKFSAGPDDSILFTQDPHLHIEGRAMPYFKNSPVVEQKREEPLTHIIERTNIKEPKADEEIEYKAPTVNWGKILLLSFIALVVIAGAVFLFQYLGNKESDHAEDDNLETTTQTVTASPENNTTNNTGAVTAPEPEVAATVNTYTVAIGSYNTQAKAESRAAKLQSYGNAVNWRAGADSNIYYVVMEMTGSLADSTRVIDSLKTLFNPGGNVHVVGTK